MCFLTFDLFTFALLCPKAKLKLIKISKLEMLSLLCPNITKFHLTLLYLIQTIHT